MIDLHTHTTASDGSFSPTELITLAKQTPLDALAITDHDTLAGLAEARQAAADTNLELVPGVELACKTPIGTLHMLGYFVDENSKTLADLLEQLVISRRKRNPEIVAKLNELGFKMTMDQVRLQASGPIISRLHIAQVMLQNRYVRSIDEAFGRFLGDEGSAYVHRFEPEPALAIEAIHKSSGLAVVAHPVHLRAADQQQLYDRLSALTEVGLDGIEVWYPEHSPAFTASLWQFCRRNGLAAVGGSDFHGSAKSYIKLGIGRGGLNIPLEILDGLRSRL